jgi:hypothetical protein
MGMDYVVENKELKQFQYPTGEAYNGLGDLRKKTCFG